MQFVDVEQLVPASVEAAKPARVRKPSKRAAAALTPSEPGTVGGAAASRKRTGKPGSTLAKTYDKHRQVARAVTVTAGAIGAVKLNQRMPDGVNLGIARVPAGAVGAIAALGGAMVAKRAGYPRIASGLVDLGLGGAIGTLVHSAATGMPLIARKAS